MPFNIQGPELILILIIALIVIGPGKLPDVGSALGKSIREFRKAATDVKETTRLDAAPAASSANGAPAASAAPPAPGSASTGVAAPVPVPAAASAPATATVTDTTSASDPASGSGSTVTSASAEPVDRGA